MVDRQLTLGDVDSLRTIKGLSENQRKIVSLVNCGLTQAQVAQRLGFSRAYINQQIKRLLSFNLIQRIETHPSLEGKRDYTHFYELSPQVREQVGKGTVPEPFTAMRTHNIRRKFKILSQSAPPTKDKRTSYSKSWMMRGGERHKYWFPGKAGMPSVTVDVHPKTLVFYMDRGQTIVAKTKEEARDIAWLAIYKAKDQFILEQSRLGITFETEIGGEEISKPHVGLTFRENGPLDYETHIPGTWVDKSVEKELGPGYKEFEMHIDHPLATPLERAVRSVATIEDKLPEMFQNIVNPIAANVLQVQAMMQGSITNQQMLENVTKLISSVLVEMQSIRQENAELKQRLGMM